LNALVATTRDYFLDGPGRDDAALHPHPPPLRAVLRVSATRDDRLIAFRGPDGPFPSLEAFARLAMAAHPELVGVVRILSGGQRGGATVRKVAGQGFIDEMILDTAFRVPASTFLQIHARAADVLGRHVLDGAGSPAEVVELYGGVGGFGLALARRGARVTVVEADPDAVACGSEAALRAGLAAARFVTRDVLAFLAGSEGASAPDLLIADPPRTGFARGVAEAIGRLAPRRIALVSCDPATLARDIAGLVKQGYALDRVSPFDLFPQTAHVEAVAWLSR
jgi:23S rRNA (uracil1939-C5)-methyltransferase